MALAEAAFFTRRRGGEAVEGEECCSAAGFASFFRLTFVVLRILPETELGEPSPAEVAALLRLRVVAMIDAQEPQHSDSSNLGEAAT